MRSNGAAGTRLSSWATGGSGAGGSVLLEAKAVHGHGAVEAIGGKGHTSQPGGSGSGGRIAVKATEGPLSTSISMNARGGTVGDATQRTGYGAAGTIYTQAAEHTELIVRANGADYKAETPLIESPPLPEGLSRLSIEGHAKVRLGSAETLVVDTLVVHTNCLLSGDDELHLDVGVANIWGTVRAGKVVRCQTHCCQARIHTFSHCRHRRCRA